MAKTKISEWSTTPSNNTDIDGINIAEGCAPSGINDAIRDLMAQVRSWQSGASADPFNGPMNGTIGATTAYSGAFTTLSASSTVTLSGGTANGVTYLNGSKVLTSGSALTFDGVNLATNTAGTNATLGINSTSSSIYLQSRPDISYSRLISSAYQLDLTTIANQPISFGVNNAEAMRLTSTGLGIGTSSPSRQLQVSNASNAIISALNGSIEGVLNATTTNVNVGSASNHFLTISTNGTERARIDTSGNLLVGTTSNNGRLSIQGSDTGSTNAFYVSNSTPALAFRIQNDGYINLGALPVSPYNNTTGSAANLFVDSGGGLARSTSSLKYKRDVQDAAHGLTEVMALRSVTYKGKSEADGDTVFGGLIAEEVHAAGLTEFVQYANDGSPDALAYGNMVSLCIKAIQELNAKFEAYKATHP